MRLGAPAPVTRAGPLGPCAYAKGCSGETFVRLLADEARRMWMSPELTSGGHSHGSLLRQCVHGRGRCRHPDRGGGHEGRAIARAGKYCTDGEPHREGRSLAAGNRRDDPHPNHFDPGRGISAAGGRLPSTDRLRSSGQPAGRSGGQSARAAMRDVTEASALLLNTPQPRIGGCVSSPSSRFTGSIGSACWMTILLSGVGSPAP